MYSKRTYEMAAAWRNPVLLSVLVVVVVTGFWLALPGRWQQNQSFDYRVYYEPVARRVLAGSGLWEQPGRVAAFYPPGFPLLLAGVFGVGHIIGETLALRIFIILCTVLSTLLIYAIANRICGRQRALWAGVLWASYPAAVWLTKQPNSETPFLPFYLAVVYLFVRMWPDEKHSGRFAFGCGLAAGLSSLIRPIAIFYGLALAAFVIGFHRHWSYRRRLGTAALLLAGNVAAVAPWEIWVYAVAGETVLLCRNGAASRIDGLTFAILPQDSGVPLAVTPATRALMEKVQRDPSQVKTLGGWARFLGREAVQNPRGVLELMLLKARRSWYGTQSHWLESGTLAFQVIYLGAALAGCWAMRRRHHHLVMLLALTVAYFWTMAVIVPRPLLRYLVPAMALLMIPAADALVRAAQAVAHRCNARDFAATGSV